MRFYENMDFHTTAITITAERNNVSSDNKKLQANQNPPDFKKLEHFMKINNIIIRCCERQYSYRYIHRSWYDRAFVCVFMSTLWCFSVHLMLGDICYIMSLTGACILSLHSSRSTKHSHTQTHRDSHSRHRCLNPTTNQTKPSCLCLPKAT